MIDFRVVLNGIVAGNELHAHGFDLLGKVVQEALAVALLEASLSPTGVFLAVGEHGKIRRASLWGGSGARRFGLVYASAQAPVVPPVCRLARTQSRRRSPHLSRLAYH